MNRSSQIIVGDEEKGFGSSVNLKSSDDVENASNMVDTNKPDFDTSNFGTPPETSSPPDDSPSDAYIPDEKSGRNTRDNFDLIRDCVPSSNSPVFKQNGAYGWMLVLEGFLASVMTDGSLYSFGVFFPSYVTEFNTDFATSSWIGSVASGVTVLFAFHVGYFCDRFGYRAVMIAGAVCAGAGYLAASYSASVWQLILSQGVLFGIGCSLAYTSGLAIVGQWFTVSRGLAFGVAGSGSGTGQFILALLTGYFLETFGWRVALKYLAIIVTGTLVFCALVMRNITREENTPPPRPVPRNLHKSLRELLSDRHFFLLYMGYLVVMFGFAMPYSYITMYAQDVGLTNQQSYLLLSVVGLASGAGRIATGYVADYFGRLLMVRVTMVLAGIATFIWAELTSFVALMLYSIFFGFLTGGFIGLRPTVAASLYSDERLATVVGVITTSAFLGRLLSPPVAGWLYLIEGTYRIPIIVAGLYFLVAAALVDVMCHDLDERDVDSIRYMRVPDVTSARGSARSLPSMASVMLTHTLWTRKDSEQTQLPDQTPEGPGAEHDVNSLRRSPVRGGRRGVYGNNSSTVVPVAVSDRVSEQDIMTESSKEKNISARRTVSPPTSPREPQSPHLRVSADSDSSSSKDRGPAPRLSQSARSLSSRVSARAVNVRRGISRQVSIHFLKVRQAKHVSFIFAAVGLLVLLKDCVWNCVAGLYQPTDEEDEDTSEVGKSNKENDCEGGLDQNPRINSDDDIKLSVSMRTGAFDSSASVRETDWEEKAPEEDIVSP